MKLRNQLLALFCLFAFVAFGVFYVRLWVVQKPFGIILFLSDGMVVRHLTSARLFEGGADHHLALESWPHVALMSNPAHDFAVPDEAAAATAIATGRRVNHRVISMADGRPLSTILELARAQGRSVGIVTTGQLADAAPAAFYAHLADSRDPDKIAVQFAEMHPLDVALGGGAAEFLSVEKGGHRKDGRNLVAEMQANGRELVATKAALEEVSSYRSKPLLGLFAPGTLAFSDQVESGSAQPSLTDMVRRAIECLQGDRNGYLLIVDAALPSRATETNQGERTLRETLSLDHALATAAKYAGSKSLIVAVGIHATGGFNLNGYPLRQDHGVALLGIGPTGHPSITWASGPHGPEDKTEPANFQTPSAIDTAEDVVGIARGVGAEKIGGFMETTQVFEILRGLL